MDLPAAALPTPAVIAGLAPNPALRAMLAQTCPGLRLDPDLTPPQPTGLLRLETDAGQPLHHPGVLSRAWHRRPYALPLRLVAYAPGETVPEVIDHAVIGTRGPREAFLAHVDATALRLVEDATLGRARGAPDEGLPTMPFAGAPGWLDHQRSRWRQRLMTEWWSLGHTTTSLADIAATGRLGPVTWLDRRKGSAYLADPFPWPETGAMLAEEMPLTGGHGRIVAVWPDGRRQPILEDARHHSYPCTYAEQGTTWMLPEATDRGATLLYRLEADGGLRPVCAIAPNRRLADATLFRHAGRYWVACADLDIGAHDSLCLLHADRLEGPWLPHRLNPVRIDIRGARPAGAPFRSGGALFRPAQNCAATYGAGITIHRIDVLTPDDYRETAVAALYPDPRGPFPDGLHTLAHDGNRTWIDGKRFVLDWASLRAKVTGRLLRSATAPGAGKSSVRPA
jgi:hypothetical protein